VAHVLSHFTSVSMAEKNAAAERTNGHRWQTLGGEGPVEDSEVAEVVGLAGGGWRKLVDGGHS
jgi:hypothetical protein